MTTRRRFTVGFKAQVVTQTLRDDKTLAQIAAEYSVHPNQLSQRKATVLGAMPALFEKDENAQAVKKAAQEKQVAEVYFDTTSQRQERQEQQDKKFSHLKKVSFTVLTKGSTILASILSRALLLPHRCFLTRLIFIPLSQRLFERPL